VGRHSVRFQRGIKLDGRYEIAKLTDCKLNPSVSESITVQEKIFNVLAICDITIDNTWQKFYILSNLPNDDEWRNFDSTHELNKRGDTVGNITSHLLSFEATLRRGPGVTPDTGLFLTKNVRGQTSNSKGDSTNSESRGQKSQGIMCHGCGEKEYITPKCRNKDKWASYAAEKKSRVDTNLPPTELTPADTTELFLISITIPNSVHEDTVIRVIVATEKQLADYWVLHTCATYHVAGKRHQ